MSNEFKYLKVVKNSGTSGPKEDYKYLGEIDNITLITPLHGNTEHDAAQKYLFIKKKEASVYVRKYLPETKYETYVDELHRKDTKYQVFLYSQEENKKRNALADILE